MKFENDATASDGYVMVAVTDLRATSESLGCGKGFPWDAQPTRTTGLVGCCSGNANSTGVCVCMCVCVWEGGGGMCVHELSKIDLMRTKMLKETQ